MSDESIVVRNQKNLKLLKRELKVKFVIVKSK